MTPLEIAAKAYWNAEPDCLACGEWDGIPEAARTDPMKAMRAALLALAEAEFPRERLAQQAMTRRHWTTASVVLRAIAEDRG